MTNLESSAILGAYIFGVTLLSIGGIVLGTLLQFIFPVPGVWAGALSAGALLSALNIGVLARGVFDV